MLHIICPFCVCRLMYWKLIGGVLALTPHQLRRVNGFSNMYWGWGAEDDDMYKRCCRTNIGRLDGNTV